jgi:hypothetical protein
LRTGKVPLATFMRRLLTGYAVSFNRRYKRHGHLLQTGISPLSVRKMLIFRSWFAIST